MSILADINTALSPLGIPVETGVFKDNAPDKYIVLVPLNDTFALHGDNRPGADIEEVRLSFFCKGNYIADKKRIVKALLDADLTVTARLYNGYETETGYHHYTVDLAQYYEINEED